MKPYPRGGAQVSNAYHALTGREDDDTASDRWVGTSHGTLAGTSIFLCFS